MRILPVLAVVLALLLGVGAWFLLGTNPDPGPTVPVQASPAAAAPAAPAGAPAAPPEHPSLIVETLDHGRFDLSEHRGQWVLVNFWATWCVTCVSKIPELNAFDAAHDEIVVIGLAYEDITPAALRRFFEARVRPEYPVAIVDVFQPPADFNTPRGLPYTVLIDPDGRVVQEFLGPVSTREILDRIAAAGRA